MPPANLRLRLRVAPDRSSGPTPQSIANASVFSARYPEIKLEEECSGRDGNG